MASSEKLIRENIDPMAQLIDQVIMFDTNLLSFSSQQCQGLNPSSLLGTPNEDYLKIFQENM